MFRKLIVVSALVALGCSEQPVAPEGDTALDVQPQAHGHNDGVGDEHSPPPVVFHSMRDGNVLRKIFAMNLYILVTP